MTIRDLKQAIADYPDDLPVQAMVRDGKDTAYSNDVRVLIGGSSERVAIIDGWVTDDNENAFMPK